MDDNNSEDVICSLKNKQAPVKSNSWQVMMRITAGFLKALRILSKLALIALEKNRKISPSPEGFLV